jgi:primosomal protein N' (replication factor Y)
MESMSPMDRLVCGDVGFGKTEVAIRAAFKSVADSKQVAILVPTTILAYQHYQTFKERLKDFPCTVDYINRFKTTKQKKETIQNVKDGKVDILVGTQMVTKGLDFNHVSLVGIINADSMMSFPDFRAHERAFQLMAQVSGRAGRKNKQGKVIIQTSQAGHFLIKQVVENNYLEVFEQQLDERQQFKYPPYYRLISITIKHKDKFLLDQASAEFVSILKQKLGSRVLGPEYPVVGRINNYYLKNILIKLEKEISPSVIKKDILKDIITLRKTELFKQVRIALDVDPG